MYKYNMYMKNQRVTDYQNIMKQRTNPETENTFFK